ncbi:hypothetical protein BGZ76_010173 [Entomortierella beljakovae]|nr:hypothetical protein BGZ76_010173 [Entomortierella beljakovae]
MFNSLSHDKLSVQSNGPSECIHPLYGRVGHILSSVMVSSAFIIDLQSILQLRFSPLPPFSHASVSPRDNLILDFYSPQSHSNPAFGSKAPPHSGSLQTTDRPSTFTFFVVSTTRYRRPKLVVVPRAYGCVRKWRSLSPSVTFYRSMIRYRNPAVVPRSAMALNFAHLYTSACLIDIETRVNLILDRHGAINRNSHLQSRLLKDLSMDSLDTTEMFMVIEEEFGILIPDEEVIQFKTFDDIFEYISQNIKVEGCLTYLVDEY